MKDLVFKTVMLKGEAGGTIDRIEKTSSQGNVDTYTIYLNDGSTQTFEVTNGYSIISIEKTSTLGNIDTYTVTIDNGDTYTFDVTNGNVADSMTAQDETIVAPTIHAVKDYIQDNVLDKAYDNNILYNGDLKTNSNYTDGFNGSKISLGWRTFPASAFNISSDGISFLPGAKGRLSSYQWLPPEELIADYYTLTLEYYIGSGDIETITKTYTKAQVKDDTFVDNIFTWTEFDEGVETTYYMEFRPYDSLNSSHSLSFTPDKTLNLATIHFTKIKWEEGSTATPFKPDYKFRLFEQTLVSWLSHYICKFVTLSLLYPVGSYFVGGSTAPNNLPPFVMVDGGGSTTWESVGTVGTATVWKRLT